MKTSLSHPLRIDPLPAGNGGMLGLTFCPGKHQPQSLAGPWDRDLERDLEAIAAFGARALVTLMENGELAAVGVDREALSQGATQRGITWYHLPIPDKCAPGPPFEEAWSYVGKRLRSLLLAGERVVIHCKGGLGRTGTVAARLLVELGASPEEAFRQVRRARPGSIETSLQEQHVLDTPNLPLPLSGPSARERALGCLLGGAVGDAFGFAVEFASLEQIRASHGPAGLREPQPDRKGRLVASDDTQMTLFTVEGVLRGVAAGGSRPVLLRCIRQAYLDWLDTQEFPHARHTPAGQLVALEPLRVRRAPGNTCLGALSQGGTGTWERPINHSKGCGGVMRVAPIGCLRHRFDAGEVFHLAVEAAAMTHGHPSGYLSAGAMAALIWHLGAGRDPLAATHETLLQLSRWPRHQETLAALQLALQLARTPAPEAAHPERIARLGQGWVGEEALAIALYALHSARDFPDLLAIAANHDGDSDSTAALAGQLWGGWRGLEGIPHSWIMALDILSPLGKVGWWLDQELIKGGLA